jgi:DNA sulfur modification protein DndB
MSGLFLPALQGRFGDWLYYIALMSLDDLRSRVSYAKEIHRNVHLSDFIQRRLDDSKRQAEIAEFLLENKDRFFNSVVVGVHGGEPQWHPLEIRTRTPTHRMEDIQPIDRDAVGYLELVGSEKLFALDGQHRLAGIKEALSRNPRIGDDRISVVFVSHQNSASGLRRTRNLFIMLNKRAVAVKKPDIIALDEVDLAAIITRRLVDDHPWFSKDQIDIERHTNSLPKNDRTYLTTLGNLYDVVRIVLAKVMAPDRQEELRRAERIRLPEKQIAFFYEGAISFFERLSKIDPLLAEYFSGGEKTSVLERARDPAAPHILFRPMGLLLMVRVLVDLRKWFSLAQSFKRLHSTPLVMTEEPFDGIIWDRSRANVVLKGQSMAQRLLAYMLGARVDAARLRQHYAEWLGQRTGEVRLPRRLIT